MFHEDHDLQIIQELYQDCKRQGYEFPPLDKTHTIKSRSMIDVGYSFQNVRISFLWFDRSGRLVPHRCYQK